MINIWPHVFGIYGRNCSRSLGISAASLLVLITFANLICVSEQIRGASKQLNKKAPTNVNENTWTMLMEGEWMVVFYAPWCPACARLDSEWNAFASWSDDLNIGVASADVTTNPGLTGRFLVSGLPTIFHIKDGVLRTYNGPRELSALISFIEGQRWKTIEPVSRWLAPGSLIMSFISYCFRVAMLLRYVHDMLVEYYGFPPYASYLIFALATILCGTLLGLLIIFVIDNILPTRYTAPLPASAKAAVTSSSGRRKKSDNDSDFEDETTSATTKSKAAVEGESGKAPEGSGFTVTKRSKT